MKFFSFFLLVLLFFTNSYAQELNKLLSDFESKSYLKHAHVGLYALYADSNKIIIDVNSDKTLIPASTQKLITTSVALQKLGSEFKFQTKVYYSGEVKDSVLHGNIVIKGGGDPTLGSERFNQQNFIYEWVMKIKSVGIKEVKGGIFTDISSHSNNPIHNWIWGDIANYYGAAAYSINLFDNTQKIHFKTGNIGDTAKIVKTEPEVNFVNYKSEVISSNISSDEAYIYGSPFDGNRLVKGKLPANRNDFLVKAALPSPNKVLEQLLKMELISLEVVLSEEIYPNNSLNLIFIHESHPLKDIIYWTNQISMNLYAEAILLSLCSNNGQASYDLGVKEVETFISSKGIEVEGMHLTDGSGLSRNNGVTTKQMVKVLQQVKSSKEFSDFYKSLPISGESGTLRNFAKSIPGKVHAKSGYINGVRCYSGYLTTKSGREVIFSVMINNYTCSNYQIKKDIESLLIQLQKL
jgi:D-alanyl-D-alanine carboxypeptidase/D-alanyl-D-alanine-endopeptidase (penicillin-binding protein 4)